MEQAQANIEQAQPNMFPADILEQLNRREQQLEQLRNAYVELQQRQPNHIEQINKNVAHIPIFTGMGDITINSFLSNVEYLLGTIANDELKKEATKAIYYRSIQGEAKNIVINIPQPDNWEMIKRALKLRYRPDTEPHQIYKRIYNLRVNTVSELSIEIQNIKYKSDEIIAYYRDDHCIDLSNINSLLVNTVKEMTQGILLDKIYDERNLGNIIDIMTRRRFEDSCIRPEYRKSKFREDITFKQNRVQDKNSNNNNRQAYYRYNQGYNQPNYRQNQQNSNNEHYPYHNQNREYRGNNSGQFRQTQQNFNNLQYQNQNRENYSNQVRRNQQNFNGGYQFNRSGQIRRNQQEPMEVDNIELINNRPQRAGHPRQRFSQERLDLDRQGPEGIGRNYDSPRVAGHPSQGFSQECLDPDRQSQVGPNENIEEEDNAYFFTRPPQRGYPE